MKPHPIKQAIDAACKRQKISHSDIARNAGVSRETLYRLMRGDGNRAIVTTVCAIARAAGLAPIVLLRLMYTDLDNGTLTLLPVSQDGDHVSFIADVTIPDGSMVLAGQRFKKTWMLQNTGVVPWVGRKLRCVDSELVMARWVVRAGKRALVPDVSPGLVPSARAGVIPRTESGATAEVSVTFRAPPLPCDTASRWKMVDSRGELCFPEHSGMWCPVSVAGI